MSNTDNDVGLDQPVDLPADQVEQPAPAPVQAPIVEPAFNTDKLKAVLTALGAFTGNVEKYFDDAVALVKKSQ
jgi:hypothetical protein